MSLRQTHTYIHTRWCVAECGVCRHGVSLQCVGDQQLTETHHDWIVMIVIREDHPNPRTETWNEQETHHT